MDTQAIGPKPARVSPGHCPACGSIEIIYGDQPPAFDDEGIFFAFECGDCHARGDEQHIMTFSGFQLDTPAGSVGYDSGDRIGHPRWPAVEVKEEAAPFYCFHNRTRVLEGEDRTWPDGDEPTLICCDCGEEVNP